MKKSDNEISYASQRLSIKEQEFTLRSGRVLRAMREHCGLTREQLAERAGITFQQLQKYENGSNRISLSRLDTLLDGLALSPQDFCSFLWPQNKQQENFSKRFVLEQEANAALVRLLATLGRQQQTNLLRFLESVVKKADA